MNFDYNVYLRQNCLVPISFLVFTGIMFVGAIVSFVKGLKTDPFLENAFYIVVMIFLIYISLTHISQLARGGLFLLTEKESDSVMITGFVEETIEIGRIGRSSYEVENNYGWGEALVIDGEKYYLMTYGDVKTGDEVKLKVLPRSHYVLELWLVE